MPLKIPRFDRPRSVMVLILFAILLGGSLTLGLFAQALEEGGRPSQGPEGEVYISDAYGLFLPSDMERAKWSGLQRQCSLVTNHCEKREVSPAPIERVDFFLGEKSIIVGEEESMALAILKDALGNLLQSGMTRFHIGSLEETPLGAVSKGVAHHIFQASERAGIYEGSAEFGPRQSRRLLYRQIPDIASIALAPEETRIRTIEGSRYDLATAPLLDRYNNPPPPGLYAQAIFLDDEDRVYIQPLIAGERAARIKGYSIGMSGEHSGVFALGRRESPPFSLFVTPLRLRPGLNIIAHWDESSQTILIDAQNIRTDQGALVSDATPFTMEISEQNGKKRARNLWSLDGALKERFGLGENAFPLKLSITSEYGSLEAEIDEGTLRYE